ncbi:uncharacterized protein [Coffea arabica]|uniref:Uncharacterized protein n=1 Tax=Coffea arabica TaxID=13443 RepID=A0ABM4UFW2_COFAR
MEKTTPKIISDSMVKVKANPPPSSSRLEKSRKQDKEKEILEVFRKVQVNIPLLDTIKQVHKYTKFLKDLCVNKRKLRGNERIMMEENVSAVLQRKLPPKCRDPDVLVQVNELVFPVDFYILDMETLSEHCTKIDVKKGTLTMEFDGEMIHFNIFDVMKYPFESHSVFAVSVINPVVQEVFELNGKAELEVTLIKHLELKTTYDVDISSKLKHMVELLQSLAPTTRMYELASLFMPESHQKLLPSMVQALVVELKPLPDHLKYNILVMKKPFWS